MTAIKTKTKTVILGENHELVFTGEIWEGKTADTKVELNGKELCWIIWEDVDKFSRQMQDVISEFRI